MTSAARNGQHVATVYERLRKAILKGEIAPGATASQVALAKQLGVSRTPLREALRLLEREGLVLSEPNRRARIAEFSISDVEELYLTRVSLEAVAARITVPTLTPDDFADIEGSMAQIVQLAEHAARYRFNWCQVDPGSWETRRAEHRSIVEAAASGDAELTAARLVAHCACPALVVMAALDPEHEPRSLVTAMEVVAPASITVISEGLKGTLAGRILQRIAHTEREV